MSKSIFTRVVIICDLSWRHTYVYTHTHTYIYIRSTYIYIYIYIAVYTKSLRFLKDLAGRLRSNSGNVLSFQHLIQRLSVTVQRGNAAAVQGSLLCDTDMIDFDDF